jgi:hypothetical protein
VGKFSKLRIVVLLLEFGNWNDASKMSYSAMFGLEEGLRAEGIEPLVIPTTWLPRATAICGNQKFDQVWVEVVHQNVIHPGWLQWLAELAPVRLAFLPESLQYTAGEVEVMPHLLKRRHGIETRLRYMTHALAIDEKDAATIDARDSLHGQWWVTSIPRRFLTSQVETPPRQPAVFPGTPYGKRQQFLEHPTLRGLLVSLSPPEQETIYPLLFDALQAAATNFVSSERQATDVSLSEYMNQLRRIRQETFALWLDGLRTASAVVNLPHMVKAYAGRVHEAIAAGRPVVSWEIPDRPRNRALWEDGREILLFDGDSPESLAERLQYLNSAPQLATQLAQNALAKFTRVHTSEHRVRQILEWIESGTPLVFD